ncbi:hypothetical protein [Photobacterium toruni]|uniref:Lysozyme inhibitor LprI N-terminal domain-containing protein n=1 Tax=Photobacterium toruni TaxID=1935446 RepID=A0A1T4RHZ6_9GAMM|nr:hypothetical protein [Photobacterium toruni]MEC6813506.1 hypothetical protein [Photobacterium toruni]MEC6830683.1 hypothetical protein [Photobacterium toruni]SKA15301.1 hypothetical protein CZ814_01313 [Photobacterium toruni]
MKPFSLLCTLFLTIACSSADVAELKKSTNSHYKEHCGTYLAPQVKDYFNDFIYSQLQQINDLKGTITDENMNELHNALYQFEAHWLILKKERYNACQRYANCTELERQYVNTSVQHPRDWIASSQQVLCQKSSFEYAISRIKMVTFYTDVERLELIRQE